MSEGKGRLVVGDDNTVRTQGVYDNTQHCAQHTRAKKRTSPGSRLHSNPEEVKRRKEKNVQISEIKSVQAVSSRVLCLPVPQVAAHGLQILLCTEPELSLCDTGVRRQIWDVSAPENE